MRIGANVNLLDRNSLSPLMIASRNGHFEMVKFLLQSGARINQKDRFNLTALSYACMMSHEEIAIELITKGCECTWCVYWNISSPIEYLIDRKLFKIIKYLSEAGHDFSKDINRKSN